MLLIFFSALSCYVASSCYRGYRSASAQQAPLWGGTLKAGMQRNREEEGGTWELYHSNIYNKSTFFIKTPDCSFKCHFMLECDLLEFYFVVLKYCVLK